MKRLLPVVALSLLSACASLGLPEPNGPLSAFDAAQPTTSTSTSSTLAFNDAWASITPTGTTVAAGYLTLANTGGIDDRLVSASTPRATRVDVHEMSLVGKTMKMRSVQRGVVVPAGGEVAFKQGGLHLMFTGIDSPFVEGETVPVTLVFQKAGEVEVSLRISDQPTLSVADAWIGITPQGATVAAGYLTVANTGIAGDKLISAESSRAGRVELHEMSKNGRTMKMRPVKNGITVPASTAVLLEKGGLHLMFMDIDAPFAEGDTVPVTLTFEKAGTVELRLDVKPPVVAQH